MHCQIVKRGWLSCGPSRFGSDLKTEEKLDRSQAGWRTAKAWPVDTNHMNPLAQAKPYTEELFSVVQQEMSGAFFFRLWLVAGYKIVNDIYLLWKKKPALFRLVISYQSFFFLLSPPVSFISTSLSLSVSCLMRFADRRRSAFIMPVDSLTNHVAWRCLLSNGTNQAHSEGPVVNWHGCGRDGRQPIRLYWFKRIAPHLRGIYQCVNCPLANHKSPARARTSGICGISRGLEGQHREDPQ